MKIKTRYTILSLMVVILLVVPGILFALEPVTAKQPITMKGVFFSKTPQSVPLTLPPELKNLPPTPAPLTPQVRNDAINQIRRTVGLGALTPRVPATPVVPAHVVLTPDLPKSGLSYYVLYRGHNYPDPTSWTGTQQNKPFSYSLDGMSYLVFTFDTLPGKTYMIDLTMWPQTVLTLSGVFTGDVTSQADHVIIGFTANARTSSLQVKSKHSSAYIFYRGELTQVN